MTSSSKLTRKVKDLVLGSVEALWVLGFAVAARLARNRVEQWSSPHRQRVWVIAPHPDDEAIGCAGTIMRHRHSGDDVCIVYVTDGRRSRAMGLGSDAMVQRRHQEALTSAASLDVARVEWLGLREGDWQPGQLFARLASLTQRFAPHVIYAPSRVDFHPEHRAVAHALASFLVGQTLTALVRVYQVQVPLTSILTNLVTDVSGVKAESEAARRAYVTQADSVRRTRRLRRYAGATYRIGAQTESFWQMSIAQYCALHNDDRVRSSDTMFRSIRHRSFSDPLAYLLGRFERRRLLNIVRHTASDAMRKAISDSGEL